MYGFRIDVLDVGDGLCVGVETDQGGLLFDCGAHTSHPKTSLGSAWRRCVSHEPGGRQLDTILASHVHVDHYAGLLHPIPSALNATQIVVGRLPQILGDRPLAYDTAARLIVVGGLELGLETPDVDLVRQIKRYATSATVLPLSQGDSFVSAGVSWEVLWPPRVLDVGASKLSSMRRAIERFDAIALGSNELASRLAAARESDTYTAMVRNDLVDEPVVELSSDESFEDDDEYDNVGTISPDRPLTGVRQLPVEIAKKLEAAARGLISIANQFSVVVYSSELGVLLTGDATKQTTNEALNYLEHKYGVTHFAVVVTPHHGTRGYFAHRFRTVSSLVWISSAGQRLWSKRSYYYGALGPHLHTHPDGDISLLVGNRRGNWRFGDPVGYISSIDNPSIRRIR